MRPRYLDVVVKAGGFDLHIGRFKIQKFVNVLTADTVLVCPKCKQKTTWHGGYDCNCCPYCGKPMEKVVVDQKGTVNWKCEEHGYQDPSHYNHWSQLLRVDKATGEPIVKEKFTEEGKDVEAQVYTMDLTEFANIADATLSEYGIVTTDEKSTTNLKKMLIATKSLKKVVLLKFKDTYEERITILTMSISKRVILKEIVPKNLLSVKDTLKADLSTVTQEELAETQQFIKTLPVATEDQLEVSDYRTQGLKIKPITAKVIELEAILAKQKA